MEWQGNLVAAPVGLRRVPGEEEIGGPKVSVHQDRGQAQSLVRLVHGVVKVVRVESPG